MEFKANVVKNVHKPNNKKKKHVGDGPSQSSKNGDNKRFKGKCYNCNKVGHHADSPKA